MLLLMGLAVAQPLKAELHSLAVLEGGAQSSPPVGEIYVVAVLTLTGLTPQTPLRQLELYDKRVGQPAGNPQYVCVDEGDAVVPCEGAVQRMRAVWSVPEATSKAAVYFEGKRLTRRRRL